MTSEKLRSDFIESLEFTRKSFPGTEYDCLSQPDGWSAIDDSDAAAGWNKAERGAYGCFSDYMWDFNMDDAAKEQGLGTPRRMAEKNE